MNQKCITRPTAQTMHFMLHNTDWVYSSISTDDCRGFWNSCTLYLPVQHTGTYAYIHPICSPFLRFRQLYKSPLDPDSAIYSIMRGVFLRTIAEVSGIHAHYTCPFNIPVLTPIFIPSAARFYIFASFIKAPLTWTALFIVSFVVGLSPGRRQLSEMGEKVKIKYLELKIDLRIL